MKQKEKWANDFVVDRSEGTNWLKNATTSEIWLAGFDFCKKAMDEAASSQDDRGCGLFVIDRFGEEEV